MDNAITRKTNSAVEFVIRATNSPGEVIALYLATILIGGGIFSMLESVAYFDSVYWAVTTSTSTGYGDISPKTVGGKCVAMFLMVFTILFIVPQMIFRVIEVFNRNKHEWTDEEQCRLFANQKAIMDHLGLKEPE